MPPEPDHGAPLSAPTFFILLSLASGPLHGYAIMKEVGDLSGETIRLSTGTLYGALKRLLVDRWIRPTGPRDSRGPGRPRRAYELTRAGREALSGEASRLQALARMARRHLPAET